MKLELARADGRRDLVFVSHSDGTKVEGKLINNATDGLSGFVLPAEGAFGLVYPQVRDSWKRLFCVEVELRDSLGGCGCPVVCGVVCGRVEGLSVSASGSGSASASGSRSVSTGWAFAVGNTEQLAGRKRLLVASRSVSRLGCGYV